MSPAALLLSLSLLATSQGSSSGSLQGPSLEQFVAALQQAVAKNDRPAVAAMMRYPLTVSAAGLQIPVSDAKTFVSLYDTVMSPAVRQVIARARVPAEGKPAAGAVRTAGGGISFEGAVTITPAGNGFRVTGLALPTAPQSTSPGEPDRATPDFPRGPADAGERQSDAGRARSLRLLRRARRVGGRTLVGRSRAAAS